MNSEPSPDLLTTGLRQTAQPVGSATSSATRQVVLRKKDPALAGKRVAMVVLSSYPFDPRPRRAAETLIKEGMSVDLICLDEKGAPKEELHNGINVRRVAIEHKRAGKLAYIYEYLAFIAASTVIVAQRMLRRPYDVVYVHNMPNALVICGLMPKLLGAKIVLDVHDPMPELMVTIFGLKENSFSVWLTKLEEKWSMGWANKVITVNDTCKRIFANRSCPEEKIEVVMNSPDESIFPFRTPSSYSVDSQKPDRLFVIMYHGSLLERNGLDLAVEALPKVLKSVPGAELRIYGKTTPFLERVMARVKELGVESAVSYHGPKLLEQLVPAIEACDVGVIPNHNNMFTEINTPTRIFEYLALGKPVIAPRTPGIQDYFNNESLFFFESGNADQLAEKIIAAASDRKAATEVAERAQQVYLTHTWERERQLLVGAVSSVARKSVQR